MAGRKLAGMDREALFNRRVAMKATASFVAMAATTQLTPSEHVAAEEAETSSLVWVESEHPEVESSEDGSRTFAIERPFFAVAPTWSDDAIADILVEISVSNDGTTWTDSITVGEATHDAGQPDRAGRRFGDLLFADGASFVRYRAFDSTGATLDVPGLAFTCIDSSAGPAWADAVGAESATGEVWQPPIISRAAWGANEKYRFDSEGEVHWPTEFRQVEHVIVHHTVTPSFQDPLIAVRAVYYYHAVDRGWGDIGYNYLVDHMGNVYEGRYGGESVVGGHAYEYAYGSSGIGLLGNFTTSMTTPEAQAGLVWIAAWVGRNLDPHGTSEFHDTDDLPTICAHRDVNVEICPGDGAYSQLDTIRDHVAAVLAGANPTVTSEFYPGDTVQVIVNEANLRNGPGTEFDTLTTMPFGLILTITEESATNEGYAWYGVSGDWGDGWCAGVVLERIAVAEVTDDGFAIGDRVVVATDMLNLRSSAGRSAPLLASLPQGTPARITDGPIRSDGYVWHEIDSDYGLGWTVGIYLAARGSGIVFAIGERVIVDTDAILLRKAPGQKSKEIVSIPRGTRLKITDPPVTMDGHEWYGVDSNPYGPGWAAGTYLSPA